MIPRPPMGVKHATLVYWARRLCQISNPDYIISQGLPIGLGIQDPHLVETFLENKVSDETKRKLLWDNCASYYGIQS